MTGIGTGITGAPDIDRSISTLPSPREAFSPAATATVASTATVVPDVPEGYVRFRLTLDDGKGGGLDISGAQSQTAVASVLALHADLLGNGR